MAKLLPFEHAILSEVGSSLSPEQRGQFAAQVAHINKVQRLLEWNEIEFYCMRWFKVRWPTAILFQNHGEFMLGAGTLRAPDIFAPVKVWAVGGHIFSIESEAPLKAFRTATDVSFALADAAQPIIPPDAAR
ncbi:hypothetical protein [Desulfuromonas soudanensis]|uniref:hypothetical protein n=1 Tax=Desulfuromonas soudanensis TaxID=1603606 RepID=UPI0006AD2838|nr:hypothetical protein [Desulfuromonas soudanensis]